MAHDEKFKFTIHKQWLDRIKNLLLPWSTKGNPIVITKLNNELQRRRRTNHLRTGSLTINQVFFFWLAVLPPCYLKNNSWTSSYHLNRIIAGCASVYPPSKCIDFYMRKTSINFTVRSVWNVILWLRYVSYNANSPLLKTKIALFYSWTEWECMGQLHATLNVPHVFPIKYSLTLFFCSIWYEFSLPSFWMCTLVPGDSKGRNWMRGFPTLLMSVFFFSLPRFKTIVNHCRWPRQTHKVLRKKKKSTEWQKKSQGRSSPFLRKGWKTVGAYDELNFCSNLTFPT